jgi:EpsI family protein
MNLQKSEWVRTSLVVVLFVGTALFLRSRGQAEILPSRQGRDIPIPQWALDVLGNGEFVERSFTRGREEPAVDLFGAYFPSQRMGSTMHSPQNCLPGSGWTPVEFSRVELPFPGGEEFKVNRYVIAKGLSRMLVLYWYQAHGRVVASEYWAKFYLVEDAIRMNRSDGALVRIITPISQSESATNAERRAVDFVQTALPILPKYVPQ